MKRKFLLGGAARNLALSVVGISAVLAADAGIGAARVADGAVVFMYHRFGETKYPSTNIRIEQLYTVAEALMASGNKLRASSPA